MKTISVRFALLSALLVAVRPAQAQTTIKFDPDACAGSGFTQVLVPYVEAGFQVVFSGGSGYGYWCTADASYPGSGAIFNESAGGLTTLSKVGGGTFSLNSIDLAAIFDHDGAGSALFTGDLSGGGTITLSQSWNASSVHPAFKTDAFGSAWANLLDVKFSQSLADPFYQFDNVVVNSPFSITPELGTMGLLATGLMGIAGIGRRRKRTK